MDDACFYVHLVFALSEAFRLVQPQQRRGTCFASVTPSSRVCVNLVLLTMKPVEPNKLNRLHFPEYAFSDYILPSGAAKPCRPRSSPGGCSLGGVRSYRPRKWGRRVFGGRGGSVSGGRCRNGRRGPGACSGMVLFVSRTYDVLYQA